MERRTVVGTVITQEQRKTRNDKLMVKIRVRTTDNNIVPLVLWEEMGRDYLSRGMLNKKGHFEGVVTEQGDISVKFFDSTEAPRPTAPASNVEDIEKYMNEKGFVRVQYIVSDALVKTKWDHKRFCVNVSGKWENKIEYCMRVLGPEEVSKHLMGFSTTTLDLVGFNQAVDNMLILSAQSNGDEIFVEDGKERDEETAVMLGVVNE